MLQFVEECKKISKNEAGDNEWKEAQTIFNASMCAVTIERKHSLT